MAQSETGSRPYKYTALVLVGVITASLGWGAATEGLAIWEDVIVFGFIGLYFLALVWMAAPEVDVWLDDKWFTFTERFR